MHSRARKQVAHHGETDMLGVASMLSVKEVQLAVETMILYEAAKQGLSWWGRAKRRVALTKKYA